MAEVNRLRGELAQLQRMMERDDAAAAAGAGCRTSISDISDAQVGPSRGRETLQKTSGGKWSITLKSMDKWGPGKLSGGEPGARLPCAPLTAALAALRFVCEHARLSRLCPFGHNLTQRCAPALAATRTPTTILFASSKSARNQSVTSP